MQSIACLGPPRLHWWPFDGLPVECQQCFAASHMLRAEKDARASAGPDTLARRRNPRSSRTPVCDVPDRLVPYYARKPHSRLDSSWVRREDRQTCLPSGTTGRNGCGRLGGLRSQAARGPPALAQTRPHKPERPNDMLTYSPSSASWSWSSITFGEAIWHGLALSLMPGHNRRDEG